MELLRIFLFVILELTSAVFYENNAYLQFMHQPPCCHKVRSQHQVHRLTPFEHQTTLFKHVPPTEYRKHSVVSNIDLEPRKRVRDNEDLENKTLHLSDAEKTPTMYNTNSTLTERDVHDHHSKTTHKTTMSSYPGTPRPRPFEHQNLFLSVGQSSSSSESQESRYRPFFSFLDLSYSSLSESSSYESKSFYIPIIRFSSSLEESSSSDSY